MCVEGEKADSVGSNISIRPAPLPCSILGAKHLASDPAARPQGTGGHVEGFAAIQPRPTAAPIRVRSFPLRPKKPFRWQRSGRHVEATSGGQDGEPRCVEGHPHIEAASRAAGMRSERERAFG